MLTDVKKVETEYELYDDSEPESVNSVYESIFTILSMLDDQRLAIREQMSRNEKRKEVSGKFGIRFRKFGEEYYEADDELLDLQERITDGTHFYLAAVLREKIDEGNYCAIGKMANFARDKYMANKAVVDNRRKELVRYANGEEFSPSDATEDSLFVEVFLKEEMERIFPAAKVFEKKSQK